MAKGEVKPSRYLEGLMPSDKAKKEAEVIAAQQNAREASLEIQKSLLDLEKTVANAEQRLAMAKGQFPVNVNNILAFTAEVQSAQESLNIVREYYKEYHS